MIDEPTLSQWLDEARALVEERKLLHALQLYHKITAAAPSLDIAWVPVEKLLESPLYPDVGKQLYEYLTGGPGRSIEFIENCMERGFW